MKPKTKWDNSKALVDGKTRPPETPLAEGAAESFRAVQPAGFKDHVDSSVEAAIVDPDVQDSEGGE